MEGHVRALSTVTNLRRRQTRRHFHSQKLLRIKCHHGWCCWTKLDSLPAHSARPKTMTRVQPGINWRTSITRPCLFSGSRCMKSIAGHHSGDLNTFAMRHERPGEIARRWLWGESIRFSPFLSEGVLLGVFGGVGTAPGFALAAGSPHRHPYLLACARWLLVIHNGHWRSTRWRRRWARRWRGLALRGALHSLSRRRARTTANSPSALEPRPMLKLELRKRLDVAENRRR